MTKNRFSKAIRHLKSTEVDDRLKSLEESAPTNSISGVYAKNAPGFRYGKKDPEKVFYPDLDGNWPAGVPGTPGQYKYVRPAGYWDEGPGTVPSVDWEVLYDADYSYDTTTENNRNTDSIIDKDTGFVKTALPPNSRSFILGPMVDSYRHVHGYDNITRLGYIQKDTREFVLLASFPGTWGDDNDGNPIPADGFESSSRVWDGQESSVTIYNDNFTYEMFQWFHNKLKESKYTKNVAFYLSGGVGCIIGGGGDGQPEGSTQGNSAGGGGGPWPKDAGDNGDGGQGGGGPNDQDPPPNEGTPQDEPQSDDPPTPPLPLPPERRRKRPGEPGYDPEVDGDDTNWNPDGTPRNTPKDKTPDKKKWTDDNIPDGPLTIDDFEKASDYSAYKAGGGDAARENGLSLDDIIAQGRKNIDAYDGQRNDPRTSVNQPDTPLSSYENRTGTNTGIPAYDYSQDIANSILSNTPVNIPQKHIPQKDIDNLLNNVHPNAIGNSIPVVSEPVPYSDDNFYEDEYGNVQTHTPETRQTHPNNTNASMSNNPGFMGTGNRLGAAGQAQGQVVVPKDGSEPYFLYTDHAYVNSAAMGGGEIPDPIKTAIAITVHAAAGHGAAPTVGPNGVPIPNFGLDTTTPNTGPMSNYPPNIRGDVRKQFKVPVSKLPQELQNSVTKELEYQKLFGKNESVKFKGGNVLTESRKRILREIKQPYKMKETPKQKYKMNFKGKFRPQNTPDVTASKQSDDSVKAKNAAGQTWRTKDKYWGGYESQERMNVVYDNVGHGQMYWDYIVNENQSKKGVRDRQIQEHLNVIAHEKAMKKLDSAYTSPFGKKIEEQETLQADNDPLFKRVSKDLKKKIDYSDKPAKAGYPNDPPPKMVNGYHPELGQKGSYYNKLDPQSANAMPKTGNPEIDAKVQKAKRLKKILGKRVDG